MYVLETCKSIFKGVFLFKQKGWNIQYCLLKYHFFCWQW